MARLLAAAALCMLPLAGCRQQESLPPQVEISQDPLYGSYRFGGQGVLDFGVQPLATPECSVSELICRDRTLQARLRAKGVRLQSFAFRKGKDVQHFLAKGDLEAGILGDMPAISAAAAGKIVIAAMVKQGFSSIIAGQPMLVKDLKGKRVATGIGSTAHFSLLNALESEGLTECDITLVAMEVGEMPKALAEGRIDAFSAWEPTPALAFAAHPGFHLVHKGLSFGFLCLRRDFAAAHPEQARELVAAAARSLLWMRQPGNLRQLAAWTGQSAENFQKNPYALKASQMMEITRHDLLDIPIAPQIPERLLREQELLWKEFNFLKKNGKIASTTSWEAIRGSIDGELLRGVLSESKRYGLEEFEYAKQYEAGGAK
jgi:NitT/TauT family transport system substrate-binding protein